MNHHSTRAFGCVALLGCGALLACGEGGRAGGPLDAAVADLAAGEGGSSVSEACAQASASKSYVGCDYWPTVLANNVWSIFDYVVVVANAGDLEAKLQIDGGAQVHATAIVPPNQLIKIYLPWVSDLKGSDADACGSSVPLRHSVAHAGGAYHLVSSQPVSVYQFNALEYKGAGGAEGKSWEACPGSGPCMGGAPRGCFSFTNDASLLLPSTAMTGTYRITGARGDVAMNSYFAVTGTQDGTQVSVKLSATAAVVSGGGLVDTPAGGTLSFSVNAGDVVEVASPVGAAIDLSGSLLRASAPVQVLAGVPCIQNPLGHDACDHLEQSVLPAETFGKDYVVTVPTGPGGTPVGHTVRLYGNVDGTTLTYQPPVAGAPAAINAGQVIDLGQVTADFEIKGDHEFAVGSFMLGGSIVDPSGGEGDPSQSTAVAVEQYRSKYIFLAPDDYDFSFVDVVVDSSTHVTLDGAVVTQAAIPVGGGSAYGVLRLPLVNLAAGSHVLLSDKPIGVQVMGYGSYTSYQYPGGLDLLTIAPPPIQ